MVDLLWLKPNRFLKPVGFVVVFALGIEVEILFCAEKHKKDCNG
jgi:hypothetical protein